MKHLIIIETVDVEAGGEPIAHGVEKLIGAILEKTIEGAYGKSCFVRTCFNVQSAVAAVREMYSVPEPLATCPETNGKFICNLPKGHASDHQEVNPSGTGGTIGWSR